jgi:hypothetical protein
MRGRRSAVLFVLLLVPLPPGAAQAAEIVRAEVERDGDYYLVEFQVRLDAPVERVRAITGDYQRFTALSPTIVSTEVIERRPDGSVRVKVVLRPCVLMFCKEITKISEAERMKGGEIRYVADGRVSDFYAAIEWLWVLPDREAGRSASGSAAGPAPAGATLVRYRAHLMPRFFVPPVIGPWLVRRQILHELSVVAERVESLAREPGAR